MIKVYLDWNVMAQMKNGLHLEFKKMKTSIGVALFALLVIPALSFTNPRLHAGSKFMSTREQTRYLECKVDGKLVKASDPGLMILYVPQKKEVTIWGKTSEGIISIIIDAVETTGTYTIKGNSKNGAGIQTKSFMYEVKKNGTPLNVSIETIEDWKVSTNKEVKAIRGTFNGKMQDQYGKIVEITEGKFSTQ